MNHERIVGTVAYLGGIMSVPEPFAWSWGNMCAYTSEVMATGEHVHFDRAKMSLHDYARHEILARMRGDWVIMFDTDINFDPDVAARLVRTANRHGVDVLTGIYCYKAAPHFPVLYLHNPEKDKMEIVGQWDTSCEIFQVSSAGAGCLFVRRKVFERITKELKENPFDRYGVKGEDHSFFRRLMALNIPAWCAWKIQVEHLEYKGIKLEDYDPPAKFEHEFPSLAVAV